MCSVAPPSAGVLLLLTLASLAAPGAALSFIVDQQEVSSDPDRPAAGINESTWAPPARINKSSWTAQQSAGETHALETLSGSFPQGLLKDQLKAFLTENASYGLSKHPANDDEDGRQGSSEDKAGRDGRPLAARLSVIAGVYAVLFVPVLAMWALYFYHGQPDRARTLLLPLTLCALIIGCDVVNQSLSVLMGSPMAITAAQAGALAATTGVWALGCEASQPTLAQGRGLWRELLKWSAVAVMFTLYQLVNHLVSYWCSLCERTIFANLCPAATMLVEMTVMPAAIKVEGSIRKKASVATMVLGAALFCMEYAHFSRAGVAAALLMVAVTIPYRLLQRWLLFECSGLTVGLMACYDGLFLFAPSSLIFATKSRPDVWSQWNGWLSSPTICLMLFLSLLAFSANHCVSLVMLRCASATNYLVMHNVANILVVCLGIVIFHDQVMSSAFMMIGILMSLGGGLWYASESLAIGTHTFKVERNSQMAFGKAKP